MSLDYHAMQVPIDKESGKNTRKRAAGTALDGTVLRRTLTERPSSSL